MASTLTVQAASFDDGYEDTYRTVFGVLDEITDVVPGTVEITHTEATLTVEVADGN